MKSKFFTFATLLLASSFLITFVACGSDDSSSSSDGSQTPSEATASLLQGKTFTKTTTTVGNYGEQTVENISIMFLPAPHCMVREWGSEEEININGTKTTLPYDRWWTVSYYNVSGNTITINELKYQYTFSVTFTDGGLEGYVLTATDETIKNLAPATEITSDMIGFYNRGFLREELSDEFNTLAAYGESRIFKWEQAAQDYFDLGYRIVDGQNIYRVYEYATLTQPTTDQNVHVWDTETYTVNGTPIVVYYCMTNSGGYAEETWESSYTFHGNRLVVYKEGGYGILTYSNKSLIEKSGSSTVVYSKVN